MFFFLRIKRSISAARLNRKSDPVYKENRVQKPYKARFIRKTETKNHTSEEARHPHNAATDATNTPPVPGPPPRRTSQNDLRIARRRTSRVGILAVHTDLQAATQAPCLRGRRPDVIARSTFALPEDEPAGPTNSLATQISKSPPKLHARPRPSPMRPSLQRGSRPPPRHPSTVQGRRPGFHLPDHKATVPARHEPTAPRGRKSSKAAPSTR